MNTLKTFFLICSLLISTAFAAVNINKASAEDISNELIGIGLVKATAIVNYREKNGPFKTKEQLTEVKGVGLKTVEKNRNNILLK
ncbi:MAG: hypothetical protein DWP95_01430 [Proteobacteria bacterium]|nr:MAG: hypothetical protein DWP95_01430 [Pseudomonadota bacterium]